MDGNEMVGMRAVVSKVRFSHDTESLAFKDRQKAATQQTQGTRENTAHISLALFT
jgi:hypothetical protein